MPVSFSSLIKLKLQIFFEQRATMSCFRCYRKPFHGILKRWNLIIAKYWKKTHILCNTNTDVHLS